MQDPKQEKYSSRNKTMLNLIF